VTERLFELILAEDLAAFELLEPFRDSYDNLVDEMDKLGVYMDKNTDSIEDYSNRVANNSEKGVIIFGLIAIAASIFASNRMSNHIVKNVQIVKNVLINVSKGVVPVKSLVKGSDEIADISNLLDTYIDVLNDTVAFASQIKRGNLKANYNLLSDHDQLGIALISMRDNLQNVIVETNKVVNQAGNDGDLSARIDTNDMEGAWGQLSTSINSLLASVSTPVIVVGKIMNAMTEGDLTLKYSEDARGEILSLKEDLNKSLLSLNMLMFQISDSADSVNEYSTEMFSTVEEMNSNTSEIASAIAQMSNGAQTQLSKVDETSQLIEGILESANDMAKRSETINAGVTTVVES
ncbi:hypothetical protein B484DRAFT_440207, partial [Ochromonadaceae sp. CCMP2298]